MFKENDKNLIKTTIDNYIKEKKRYPTIDNLCENKETGFFFNIIKSTPELTKEYNDLILEHFNTMISTQSTVKMKKLLAEQFNIHKDIFTQFFLLNLNKDYKGNEFQEIGLKVQDIIKICEDQLVGNMESGKSKYGVFSGSLSEKFKEYIKIFFHYYDFIGVKVQTTQNK